MSGIHEVLGIAVLAANLLAAVWGGVAWWRKVPSIAFWPILRVAQATVIAEVVLGGILWATGKKPPDNLHYVYGVAPLVVSLVCEAMRVGAAQKELQDVEDVDALDRREQVLIARRVVIRQMGVMTIGSLLIVTLALRAASSGGLF
ncbi:MAG: hypothetical protein QOE08_656 [Thermoleophilaceae bacterium]|nr:hypothetical protein [Thermoleophilaceae bacterium]